MAVVKNLMVKAGADFSALKKSMDKAQKDIATFKSRINTSLKGLGAALAAVGAGMTLGSAIKDAMKFEANMATLGETLGSSMADFQKWQNTVGRSLGFSKLQSAELANTLSLNFKGIATSQQDLLDKTTKMMEAAGVVSKKRGMQMQEVSDRIRSAMNGEADGADELGVNIRTTSQEMTEAIKKYGNGQHWADMDTNLQKAIRYHSVLDQISKNLGMTLQDTTASRMSVFQASLLDLRMALGQAWLPILNIALPALTKLTNALTRAFTVFAQFMSALFGYKPDSGSGFGAQAEAANSLGSSIDGVGDAYKKAGKEAKKAQGALAGFDEINNLADKTDTAASGDGAPGGTGDASFDMGLGASEGAIGKISKKIQDLANKVKEFFKPVGDFIKKVWGEVAGYFSEKVSGMVAFWKENGAQFLQAMSNIWNGIKPVVKWVIEFIWDSIKGLIDGCIQIFQGLIKFISGVFTGDWKKAWEGVKDIFFGTVEAVWNFFNLTLFGGIKKGFIELVKAVGKNWDDIIIATKSIWNKVPEFFSQTGLKMWAGISNAFKNAYSWFNTNVISKISGLFTNLKNFIEGRAELSWTAITNVFNGAAAWFKSKVVDSIVNHFNAWRIGISEIASNTWSSISTKASEAWEAIKTTFGTIKIWFENSVKTPVVSVWNSIKTEITKKIEETIGNLKTAFKGLTTFIEGAFSGDWSKAWEGVKGIFKGVFDQLYDIVRKPLNFIIDAINFVIKGLNKISFEIPDIPGVPGAGKKFGINIPPIGHIPALAKGGITNGPTLAMIGDNPGGREVVSPLDDLQDIIASAVGTAVMQAMQMGGNRATEAVFMLDGTTFARAIKPHTEKENGRVGGMMIKTT